MCGLAGVMSDHITSSEIELFQQLMAVSVLRGRWGAGVTILSDKNKIKTLKTQHTGANLVYGEKFYEATKKGTQRILAGHCRWPTRGGSELTDVHPHESDHIIGFHNGTMNTVMHERMSDKESDSARLIQAIAKYGFEEMVKNSTGAMALTWFDLKARTFNMYRNYERPLWVGHVKADVTRTLFWASEDGFLKMVLGRRFSSPLVVTQVPVNTWFTYPMIPQNDIRPSETKEVRQYVFQNKNRVAFYEAVDNLVGAPSYGSSSNVTPITPISGPKIPAVISDKHMNGMRETKNNFYITGAALSKILNGGCAWCAASSTMKDYEERKLHWVSAHEFLCQECFVDDEIKSLGGFLN